MSLMPLALYAQQNAMPVVSAEAQGHINAARALATGDLLTPFEFFCVPGNARPNNFSAPLLTPVQLFDNLYALGNSETVVYVIDTGAGLVLIDAGMPGEVETVLIPGLKALGLDPADVKTILLGHGHSDHYGGAAWFQREFGTRIGTTSEDWETIALDGANTPDVIKPSRDLLIRDGEALHFGDTEIMPVAIPGHTPGSLAFIFPVFDAGARHMAGLFGGTVLAANWVPMPGLVQYVESISRYRVIAEQMQVDVEIQNHPIFDATPARLAALAARKPGAAHPFVMGADSYQRFWQIIAQCMQAELVTRSQAE